MPPSRQLPRCSINHRAQLLEAASSGWLPFWEVQDSYLEEDAYFWTVAENVKAELAAGFQQGLQSSTGVLLINRQGYWAVANGTDYAPKRLAGCIVQDVKSREVFWILRCTSALRKVHDRNPSAQEGLPLDVDSILRVWFGAGENEESLDGTMQGGLKGLRPTFDLESMDINATNSMDTQDRAIEVVMFAADYGERFAAALRGANGLANRKLVAMILRPARAWAGTFQDMGSQTDYGGVHQLNDPQLRAVSNLKHRLEVIHGPPGSGKSTTIFGLLSARVPVHRTACVTCVTNQAVEAVCEKLRVVRQLLPFTVLGNPDSLGPTSRTFQLEQLVLQDEGVVRAKRNLEEVEREIAEVEDLRVAAGSRTEEFHLLSEQLEILKSERQACIEHIKSTSEFASRCIIHGTRVFVCTIASLHRITTTEHLFGPDFPGTPHTIVVDEAGATPESYMPQILNTGSENLVLLGDNKQLPPLVLTLDMKDLEEKKANRSPLERAMAQMPASWIHRLTVQYRMPLQICRLVSRLFYDSGLTSGILPFVPTQEAAQEPVSLSWLVVRHPETSVGTSWQNLGEAAAIAAWLRKKVPEARQQGKTVKCLTFYRVQRNLIQAGLDDEEIKSSVLSVDATQGSEADHVILSTVRSNERGELGFCADPRRLCVALSRAKETLTIVGDPGCMNTGLWAEVWRSVEHRIDLPITEVALRKSQQGQQSQERRGKPSPMELRLRRSKSAGALPRNREAQVLPSDTYPHPLLKRYNRSDRGPCHFWAEGYCARGKDCPFSHGFAPQDKRVKAQLKATAEPCQYHAMGKCNRGDSCPFSHGFIPGSRRVAEHLRRKAAPCMFYRQGRCRNGGSCVFLHE